MQMQGSMTAQPGLTMPIPPQQTPSTPLDTKKPITKELELPQGIDETQYLPSGTQPETPEPKEGVDEPSIDEMAKEDLTEDEVTTETETESTDAPASLTCPHCNEPVLEGWVLCPNCKEMI